MLFLFAELIYRTVFQEKYQQSQGYFAALVMIGSINGFAKAGVFA